MVCPIKSASSKRIPYVSEQGILQRVAGKESWTTGKTKRASALVLDIRDMGPRISATLTNWRRSKEHEQVARSRRGSLLTPCGPIAPRAVWTAGELGSRRTVRHHCYLFPISAEGSRMYTPAARWENW